MFDLDDHPFSPKNIALESGALDISERAWLRWADRVEVLLGHDLDGDDRGSQGCGYSIDEAAQKFDSGVTAKNYADEVRNRSRYCPPAQPYPGEDDGKLS